jgi:deoxyadenosine/deoxycytidine kinase
MIISIEGNIKSHKRNVLNFIQRVFPVEFIESRLDREQIIKFFNEPYRWAFPLLVQSLIQKYLVIQRIKDEANKIIVINRSHITDLECFAKTFLELRYISQDEYKIFKDLYQSFTFPDIDVFIYLRSSTNACYERSLESVGIYYKIDYRLLKALHDSYEEFVQKNNRCVIIDVEKYLYLTKNDKQCYELQKIMKDIITIPKTEVIWTEVQYRKKKKKCVGKIQKKSI